MTAAAERHAHAAHCSALLNSPVLVSPETRGGSRSATPRPPVRLNTRSILVPRGTNHRRFARETAVAILGIDQEDE